MKYISIIYIKYLYLYYFHRNTSSAPHLTPNSNSPSKENEITRSLSHRRHISLDDKSPVSVGDAINNFLGYNLDPSKNNTMQNRVSAMFRKSKSRSMPKEKVLVFDEHLVEENKVEERILNDIEKKEKKEGGELVNGLNVLVLQGFYSRKSLNSVQQLVTLSSLKKAGCIL